MAQRRAQNKGAHRDQQRGGDDEDEEDERGAVERREEILNLVEIRQRADAEAEIHNLKKDEEGLGDRPGKLRKLVG
jgi:hypothetical protein